MAHNRRTAIFFGNGLNRLKEDSLDWKDLVGKAAKKFFNSKREVVISKVPCPLMYEGIYLLKNNTNFKCEVSISIEEQKLKDEIAKIVNKQEPDKIYTKLVEASVTDYITANIDTNLEKALLEQGYAPQKGDNSEIRYSLHRYKKFSKGDSEKTIWYIHGNVEKSNSILFGYEQYGGQLAKIARYVNGQYKSGDKKTPKMEDRLKHLEDFEFYSWVDLFFNADIYIVGFGLAYSEIDIWWLLVKRKRLLLERMDENRYKPNTSIRFYDQYKEKNEQVCALHKLLMCFDVDVVSKEGDDYRSFYSNIINEL